MAFDGRLKVNYLSYYLKMRRAVIPEFSFKLIDPAQPHSPTCLFASKNSDDFLIGDRYGSYSITNDLVYWKKYISPTTGTHNRYHMYGANLDGPRWVFAMSCAENHCYDSKIMTSDDQGETYTERYFGYGNIGNVLYANNKYVIPSGTGMRSSDDGITWVFTQLSGAQHTMNHVTYADGVFVSVGSDRTFSPDTYWAKIYSSTDGVNWTLRLEVANPTYGVIVFGGPIVYGNGTFIVSGQYSYTSTDGINWIKRSSDASSGGLVFSESEGKFSRSKGVDEILLSDDGINWTSYPGIEEFGTVNQTEYYPSINSVVYVVSSQKYYKSTDLLTVESFGFTATGGQPHYPYRFINKSGTFYYSHGYSSDDRFTWTKVTGRNPYILDYNSFEIENNEFLAAGISPYVFSSHLVKATIGDTVTNWVGTNGTKNGTAATGLTYGFGKYVSTYANGTDSLFYSTDFNNWTMVSGILVSGDNISKPVYASGVIIACANKGRVIRSTDGVNWAWVTVDAANLYTVNRVRYLNGRFVAVCGDSVYESTDGGVTWSAGNVVDAGFNSFQDIEYDTSLGLYFIVGVSTTSKIFTSSNLVNWEINEIDSQVKSAYTVAANGDGDVLVGGTYGLILAN